MKLFIFIILSAFLQNKSGNFIELDDKLIRYYENYNKAIISYSENKYLDALKFANKAIIERKKPDWELVDIIILCNVKLNRHNEVKKWIIYSIINFGHSLKNYTATDIKGIPYYGLTPKHPIIKQIAEKEMLLNQQFLDSCNQETMQLFNELKYCWCEIQIRTYPSDINYDKIGTEIQAFVGKPSHEIIHNCIHPRLKVIMDKTNFPTAKDIGCSLYEFEAALLLFPPPQINKILNLGLISGKISAERFAQLFDRINKTNYYGTKLILNKDGNLEIDIIPEIQTIDNRRSAIGLLPLSTFAKIKKYKLPKNYI